MLNNRGLIIYQQNSKSALLQLLKMYQKAMMNLDV